MDRTAARAPLDHDPTPLGGTHRHAGRHASVHLRPRPHHTFPQFRGMGMAATEMVKRPLGGRLRPRRSSHPPARQTEDPRATCKRPRTTKLDENVATAPTRALRSPRSRLSQHADEEIVGAPDAALTEVPVRESHGTGHRSLARDSATFARTRLSDADAATDNAKACVDLNIAARRIRQPA